MVTSIRQAEGFLWLPSAFFLPTIHKKKERKMTFSSPFWYPKPGSNRYGPFGPQDFKSGVSTYSTIRATHILLAERTKVQIKFKIQKF